MPSPTGRKTRKDKGTTRTGRLDNAQYSIRLNPAKDAEKIVLDKISEYLRNNPGKIFKDFLLYHFKDGDPVHETFEQQIDRLAKTIDKLMSLNLQRASLPKGDSGDEGSDVDMSYLAKIQATLRGKK
jgi:hypothetical protein